MMEIIFQELLRDGNNIRMAPDRINVSIRIESSQYYLTSLSFKLNKKNTQCMTAEAQESAEA